MIDFFFWGGPVYCSTADLQWQRETKVFCHPLDGAANISFFNQLASGSGTPLENLMAMAGLNPGDVQSVGLAGFSAAHQLLNPILKNEADLARVNYLHLADCCFLGAGASAPHLGYVAFAKEAAAGRKMMTITSHGPRGDIHYVGPDGHHYDLTSGTTCVDLFWQAATGGGGAEGADLPEGLAMPTESRRVGNLMWWGWDDQDHAFHANVAAKPIMQMYGTSFMANPASAPWEADKLLTTGAFGALGFLLWRLWQGRKR